MEAEDGMKVTVTRDDGTQVDVTEYVRIAYDCVRQSLDWGSGFLDTEEVNGIVLLAEACGFPDFEEVVQDVWAEREAIVRRRAGNRSTRDWQVREEYTPEAGAALLAEMRGGGGA